MFKIENETDLHYKVIYPKTIIIESIRNVNIRLIDVANKQVELKQIKLRYQKQVKNYLFSVFKYID